APRIERADTHLARPQATLVVAIGRHHQTHTYNLRN
ncbi:MAG: hypothetical protein ACI8W7_004038, partial [Gammaproteobacteria bacterium]